MNTYKKLDNYLQDAQLGIIGTPDARNFQNVMPDWIYKLPKSEFERFLQLCKTMGIQLMKDLLKIGVGLQELPFEGGNVSIVLDDFKSKRKWQKAIRRADVNYCQSIEVQIPLRVLELNNEFDLLKERYVNWSQPVNKIVANNALAEFRDNTSCNLLRELTCVVCSGLFLFEYLNTVSVQEICLSLFKVSKYFEKPFFEIDFVCGHPYIDKSSYKILFDRNGFVKNDDNENLFDLRLCNNCKQSLKAGNTSIFSLANMEQLHNILPLPVYQLYDYLKVVFVENGQPSNKQLKKVLCVRKNRVAIALEWLINHNVLYKNVKLDKTALESLPENGVSTALLAITVVVNIDPKKIEHYTRYTADLINEYDINNNLDNISDKEMSSKKNISRSYDPITKLRNSGITYTDNIPISEQECTLKVLKKIIQESTNDKQICSLSGNFNRHNIP
ncbi:hypothetical protein Glove_167g16 [Diversispora epigaea]|uniref:DUF6570 domain-containing protein n=1 Tax=Diversispora epigaea TaxID=1348612 RepID=A0A397ITU1_9GLOM|nr:hypothetical protein Glove_167g16 [Diversispora epigaea]